MLRPSLSVSTPGSIDPDAVTAMAGPIFLEAESGNPTAPLQIKNDTLASAGKYVEVAANNNSPNNAPATGITKLQFTVTDSGAYKVWGRVIAPTTTHDSFWVRMNGGTWTNWNNIPGGGAWHWAPVHDATRNNAVVTYNLTGGTTATLEFAYREEGTRLDRVAISADPSFVPSGTGP
jgi:hypothetical protein